MSPPTLKYNTLMKRQHVDNISKGFIFFQLLFGINCISIIGNIKNIYIFSSVIYSFIYNTGVILFATKVYLDIEADTVFLYEVSGVFLYSFLSYLLRSRLLKFYKEINKFDHLIRYDQKISSISIHNIIQFLLLIVISFIFLFTYESKDIDKRNRGLIYLVLLLHMSQTVLLHYYCHLICQIPSRLRCVKYNMKRSYPNNNSNDCYVLCDEAFYEFEKKSKGKPRIEMGTLMDLYYNLIKAYDYLNNAIKWQLLVLLTATFTLSLDVAYELSVIIIKGKFDPSLLFLDVVFAILKLEPIFSLCFFTDRVRGEVHKLREILSCSICGNGLDKSSRTAAQAFAGLTETRDLSFSLFHMFSIDISLPFNFLGLLLTYLIILLQFDKVIKPNS